MKRLYFQNLKRKHGKKYELSADEVEFIESKVREM